MRTKVAKPFVFTSLICLVLICKNVELSTFVWKYSNKRHTFFSNTSTASSREDCASLCHRMRHCQSFQYNRNTGLCSTHPVSFETSTWDFEAQELPGNDLYSKLDSHVIGSECSTDTSCHVVNSTCYDGSCLCGPSLSFNQRDNTCVQECLEYGNEMTWYPGLFIYGYNKRTVYDVPTVKNCTMLCVSESSFPCITVDYNFKTHKCYLQEVGALDIPESAFVSSAAYDLGVRDCAL